MALHLDRVQEMARRVAGSDDGLREDLEDELIDGLIAAAESYDPDRAAFWTYAQAKLHGRVRMFFRAQQKRPVCIGLIESESGCDVIEQVIARAGNLAARQWAERMLREIGFLSEPAVDALLANITKADAARILGMNYDVFHRRLKQVKTTTAAAELRAVAGL